MNTIFVLFTCASLALITSALLTDDIRESRRFAIGFVILWACASGMIFAAFLRNIAVMAYVEEKVYYEYEYIPSSQMDKYIAYSHISQLNEKLTEWQSQDFMFYYDTKGIEPISVEWTGD